MSSFREAFEWMMDNEDRQRKGTVIVDAGGATKYGISLRFLKNAGIDIDHDGDVDADDIRLLTLEQCREIYEPHFWQPIHGDEIADQYVANKVFDFAVNAGVHQSVLLVQRALNDCGLPVAVDGACGKLTLAAINKAEPGRLMRAFKEHLFAFRKHIAEVRVVSKNEFISWARRDNA